MGGERVKFDLVTWMDLPDEYTLWPEPALISSIHTDDQVVKAIFTSIGICRWISFCIAAPSQYKAVDFTSKLLTARTITYSVSHTSSLNLLYPQSLPTPIDAMHLMHMETNSEDLENAIHDLGANGCASTKCR